MSLAIEYRPQTLEEMVGNKPTIQGLQALFNRPRKKFPHAIMFTGPTGCGKTTLGRITANMLGATEADFKEIDVADFRGIDTIREIRRQIRHLPQDPKSKCRVWLLDEAQSLSRDAQNALLKGLEDPPDHTYFIICTTEPKKLLPTVRGRCTAFQVSTLSEREIIKLLKMVCRSEKAKIPKSIREFIADQSQGHPRNALKMLEKVIGLDPDEMESVVEEEAERQIAAIELCRALINRVNWQSIAKILTGLKGEDPEGLRRMILGYCNVILLKGFNGQAYIVLESFEEPLYDIGFPGLTLACLRSVIGDSPNDDVPF